MVDSAFPTAFKTMDASSMRNFVLGAKRTSLFIWNTVRLWITDVGMTGGHQAVFNRGQSSDPVCYSGSCGLGSKITCYPVFALFLDVIRSDSVFLL